MNGSDVNDILVFISVLDSGSFGAGGRALGLSRSAAGKAISRLEKRFATRLLNRTTRALSLTEDGRSLYAKGQGIREAMEAAERSIAQAPGQPRGILRVTVADAFGRRLVLPVLRQYLDRWPDMQVEMSFSDHVVSIVEDGFDLAIRIGVTDPSAGLISRVIMRDPLRLCASPAYLQRRSQPQTTEQLTSHDLLFHANRNERMTWHLQEAEGTSVVVQGRSRLRLDSGEALRDAALAGMGISLLPGFLVDEEIAAGRLRLLLPSINAGTVPIVALYPHRRLLEGKVRHFIDMLVGALAVKVD